MAVKHYPNVCQSKHYHLIIYRLVNIYGSEQVYSFLCVCWERSPTVAEFRTLLPCGIVTQSIGFSGIFTLSQERQTSLNGASSLQPSGLF